MRRIFMAVTVAIVLSAHAATGIGADPAPAAGLDRQHLDVRAFGAKGDGVADDTAALQAAFDAAGNYGVVFLPYVGGFYRITSGLSLRDRLGVRLVGQAGGRNNTGSAIRWSGDGDRSGVMLDLGGSVGCDIENIQFIGTSNYSSKDPAGRPRSGIGLYIHGGRRTATNNHVSNCAFYFLDTAIQVGDLSKNEGNNENMVFDSITVQYCGNGYSQFWPNAMNNVLNNPAISYCDNGVRLGNASAFTGSVNVYNWNSSQNRNDFFLANLVYRLLISGARSEGAGKFLASSPGGSPMGSSVTLISALVHSDSGVNPMIQFQGNNFSAIGCTFGSINGTPLEFRFQAPHTAVSFIQTDFNSARVPLGIWSSTGSQSNIRFSFIGCRYFDSAGRGFRTFADRTHGTRFTGTAWTLENTSTPNVQWSDVYSTASNAPAISNFLGGYSPAEKWEAGYPGQKITIRCTDDTATILNNANIVLNGSKDFVCKKDANITLMFMPGVWKWHEVSRMVP